MNVGNACNRHVVQIGKGEKVLEAARRMREQHVGDLVVVEERGARGKPVGVITDRDIVVGLLAKDVAHLEQLDVGDLLTHAAITAREDEDVTAVVARMQQQGVRRMPVVDKAGVLVGIFTVDDLLRMLSDSLASVVSLIAREQRHEQVQRS